MMKKMTWVNEHQFISGGKSCSLMMPTSEISQDFNTDGLSCLSPDGTLLVLRDDEYQLVRVRKVVRHEWRIGAVLFPCQQLPAVPVLDFAWSPLMDLLAVQVAGATYLYQASGWSSRHGQQRGVYRFDAPQQEHPLAMVFAPKTKRIAQALPLGGVGLWDTDGTLFRQMDAALVLSLAWSPSERYLAVGGADATVSIYLTRSGRLLWQRTGHHTAGISALAWSPDGACLVSGDQQGGMLHWNTQGSTETWCCLGPVKPPMLAGIEACAWSPDRELAVVDSQDNLDIFPFPNGGGTIQETHREDRPLAFS